MSDPRHYGTAFDYKPEPWTTQAACAGYPTDWWFPVNDGIGGAASTETTETARALCASCPVRLACLDYAMRFESGYHRSGLWGGLSPEERRKLAKAAS